MGPQHLAGADIDGHRAGAAVPAGAGRGSRRPAAAAQPQREQGRRVHRAAPGHRAVAGPPAVLRGVLQLLVHRHLRAAVHFARRLPHAADDRARPQPACRRRCPPRATWSGCPSTPRHRPPATRRRWRRRCRSDFAAGARSFGPTRTTVELSAEKGYLREFGNLVFHFSLLGLLAAVAIGKMFGYEGNVIVIADGGPGFCSASPAAFDSFRAGNTVDGTSLYPMCVRVNDFQAHYLRQRAGQDVRRRHRLPGRRRPEQRYVAAVPARGQPPAAGRRRPRLPAGPRLRAHVHRDVPRRAEAQPDRAVAPGGPADAVVVGRDPHRSARGHLPRRRRTSQASDRASRACSPRPNNSTARCCRRATRR